MEETNTTLSAALTRVGRTQCFDKINPHSIDLPFLCYLNQVSSKNGFVPYSGGKQRTFIFKVTLSDFQLRHRYLSSRNGFELP